MTIPILPAELIGEILSRASGEIPLEFRNGIIKNVLLNLYFIDSVTVAVELDFPIENGIHGLYVKGFCNGLVYLADNYLDYSRLWNPTTRKHKNLPFFRPRVRNPGPILGFGYDELHDDYKVVIIDYNYSIFSRDDIEVKVYSLKSVSWTNVDYCICDEDTFLVKKSSGYCGETLIDNGSFVDGKLHWSTSSSIPGPDPNVNKGKYIIAFDLANENWEKVEKPSFGEGERLQDNSYRCLGYERVWG
ncbi:F-box/kelch-repeat protein At3g23880-like [Solanum stenotomum]|uniref:F-box/kelch-repeat protein At3g23880-like n=1 Tax=Solanum stenotomum TaxID=172797 RepID=UPI0020CFEE82|nr:F-box/kelch-repeat protein At3g23880-like [Solanum stenotomum]